MLASAIISKIRALADIVGSQFITDAELLGYINTSYGKLYSELASSGQGFYVSSGNINLVAGTKNYALPDSLYKLLGVDYVVDSNTTITLRPFNFKDRNKYTSVAGEPVAYSLVGSNIQLMPVPTVTKTAGIVLWYVPNYTQLTTVGDSISLPVDGMEAYLIWDVGANCQAKEESPTEYSKQKRMDAYNDFRRALSPRDEGMCQQVVDVENIGICDNILVTPYF